MTHMTVLQFFLLVVWMLAFKLTAAATDELEKMLGLAVIDSLERARVTVKEAAALMKLDESQFRKQLRGEPSNHISLTRLIRLPWAFWLWFGPSLMYLVAKKNTIEIAETFGLRKSA